MTSPHSPLLLPSVTMASLLRAAPHLSAAPSRSSGFAGVRVSVSARRVSAARRVAPARAGFFDFLKPAEEEPPARSSSKVAASVSYLCLDCGYIYQASAARAWRVRGSLTVLRAQGDLNKELPWYKCPVCDVGKNRFTKTQAAGAR